MHTLRFLRRSRDLTFLDLAQLTGIPVRLLAEAEYGLRSLSRYERFQLAFVFGVHETSFGASTAPGVVSSDPLTRSLKQGLVAAAIVATLATSALRARETLGSLGTLSVVPQAQVALMLATPTAIVAPTASPTATASPSATTSPTATASPSATTSPTATASPSATPTASSTPAPTEIPLPTATPAFVLTDAGPAGCPLQTGGRQVVVTQGYGVGSHAPAETWGGIDLTLEANPNLTRNTIVQATHRGVVQLAYNTWPAGNHIWVVDQATGWRSGYAHLEGFLVADGQVVEAGTPIGLVGMTGETTGPHLHYHVWHGDTNIDPTWLVNGCSGA